jgi:hypothetical protein
MMSLGIIRAFGAVAGALALFLLALGFAARQRRRRALRAPSRAEPGLAGSEAAHRQELRLAALERAQGELAARLDAAGSTEERLQATAGQLLGLVRDKYATNETELAGLDQLRGRMRVLEQIGDAAEARGLFERLGERLAAVEGAQAALAARGEDGAGQAVLVEELRRLHAQKDAGVEAVLGRLGPVEARLEELGQEVLAADPAVEGLRAAVEGLRVSQAVLGAGLEARLVALEAPGESPFAAVSEQLTRLYAQKDAGVEAVLARLGAAEAQAAAAGEGLAALDARIGAHIGALEAPDGPLAAVSEQLTRLYAQKDAATEAVLARLGAAEAQAAAAAALGARVGALEAPDGPLAALSGQLTRLDAQKDAATEAVLARLGPVEARLEELGREVGAAEQAKATGDAAVERLAQGIEEAKAAQSQAAVRLGERLSALEQAAGAARAEGRAAEDAARAEAEAIAEELLALRAAAAETELFADRLALLEASLPRLSAARAEAMQAPGRPAAGSPAVAASPGTEGGTEAGMETARDMTPPEAAPADPLEAFRDLPAVVSLHRR